MKKSFTLLILLVCSTLVFSQTIYYVKPSGNDANYGTSWATAFKTIQRALDVIVSGEIWVAAGTYYPDEGGGQSNNDRSASFSLRSGVALLGGFDGSESAADVRNWITRPTILSGDIDKDGSPSGNSLHVVVSNSDNASAVLDGFTISGGNADRIIYPNAGGIRCSGSSPTIRNCFITGNTALSHGGGMANVSSDPYIINCRFYNNTAIVSNDAEGGAIYNTNSTPRMVNCTFTNNHAAEGTAIYNYDSNPIITNCSFTNNSGGSNYGSAIFNTENSIAQIFNTILWADGHKEIDHENGGTAVVSYSIVLGGYSGTANINQDPMFVSGKDLHLKGCSPAINTGTSYGAPPIDYDGKPRPTLGGYDMGAYEFQPTTAPTVLYVKSNATGYNSGNSWADAFTKLQDALVKASSCYTRTEIWVAAGTYFPDEGAGLANNDRTLSFALKNNTAVYGGFNGTETSLKSRDWINNPTILSGDIDFIPFVDNNTFNSYHVVTATSLNKSAILDGFTISNANAGSYNGGGLYVSSGSPVISHCIFKSNSANYGGGIYNNAASPAISFCKFQANIAVEGAGIYNASSTTTGNSVPVVNGCSFISNVASSAGAAIYNFLSSGLISNSTFWNNSAPAGACMYNYFTNNLHLVNNTVASNTATGSGGSIYNWNNYTSQPTIINSIFWANTGGQIVQDPATVSYSLVQGGYPGGSNIFTINPLFNNLASGDLHLQQYSPAIDIGDNAGVAGMNLDADEQPRIVNGFVDLGAYEWHLSSVPDTGAVTPLSVECGGDFTVQIEPGNCGYLLDSYAFSANGGYGPVSMTFTPALNTLLPLGDQTITVSAIDTTGDSQGCSYVITVVDTIPPVIDCGNAGTLVKSAGDNCTYIINNSELNVAANDNCSIPLTFYYRLEGATTSELEGFNTLDGVALDKGQTTIYYLAFDAAGNWDTCSQVVTVEDNSVPTIQDVTVDKPVLYPPNHQLQDIKVMYYAHDNCPGMVTSLSVRRNEASSINGAGNTATDWQVIDDHHVKLRAERSGTGSDRIYTITVHAMDATGNTASATTTVTVPHDKGAVTKNRRVAGNEDITGLQVSAAPNSFNNGFNLKIQSPSSQLLNIRVLDATGRLVESRTSVSSTAVEYLGERYRPGVYYVQVMQGGEMQSVKIIKQPK